jgi:hypothetical protein
MALEEKTIIDLLAWRPETASIECRHANLILRDGTEVARQYHRHVVGPHDDVSNEDPAVQAMAATYADEREAAPVQDPTAEP